MDIINLNKPFNLKHTALSHGWVNLSPFWWEDESSTLNKIESVRGTAYHCSIKQKGIMLILSSKPTPESLEKNILKARIERGLGLSIDLDPFISLLKEKGKRKMEKFILSGGGYLLRGSTFFEDVVKTIFTCNANWSYTKKMANDICNKYGAQCHCCQKNSFPEYDLLPKTLHINAGYRGKIVERVLAAYPDLERELDAQKYDDLYRSLLRIKGIGEYSAAHIMSLGGDYCRMPIDREVCTFLGFDYSKESIRTIQRKYSEEWGRWAFLAYKIERIVCKKNWIGN